MGELGEILTRAREERGLTLDDAERDTRIARRYLEALEAEAFEVIPAPVYARGFLRSYSQYLGLDPQVMLAYYPREPLQSPTAPPARREPRESRRQSPPPRREQREPQQRGRPATPPAVEEEPVIGVNIGVPVQSGRIRTDQAGQTRTAAVAIAAIIVVVGVIVAAFVISRLGGDDGGGLPPGDGTGSPTTAATENGETPTPATGDVPAVVGRNADEAQSILEDAGYVVTRVRDEASTEPAETVTDQAPAAGSPLAVGSQVIISVSNGPN